MKILKLCTTLLLTLAMLLPLASCASLFGSNQDTTPESTPRPEPAKIVVHLNDGAEMEEIAEGTLFSEAVKMVPVKEGYVFAGWYSDQALKDYIIPDHITDRQYEKGALWPKWITVEPVTFEVRTDSATITDSGRSKQIMDTVYLSESFSITDLERAGYTKLKVEISLDVKEDDDGYQYIFFYSDTNCVEPSSNSLADLIWGDSLDEILGKDDDTDPSLIWARRFEHDPEDGEGKHTAWETHTFTCPVPLHELQENLYIRYDASGNGDDDWRNKNVIVTVTPQK